MTPLINQDIHDNPNSSTTDSNPKSTITITSDPIINQHPLNPNSNDHADPPCLIQPEDDFSPQDLNQLLISEGAELPPPDETPLAPIPTRHGPIVPPPLPVRINILLPCLIVPFAILGLLIRLGLIYINTFSGQQVFALAWPQFIGCVLMGLFVSTRKWIDGGFVLFDSASRGHWIGAFIYVGLSSGLCGSITTFSSWNLALFNELINTAKVSRYTYQDIFSALAELFVTLAVSISGLQLGMHLGEALLQLATHWHSHSIDSMLLYGTTAPTTGSAASVPEAPNRWTKLDALIISLSIMLWVGVICASIWIPLASRQSWRHIVLACCFAPAGAILRWYLSRFNARLKLFPIGTFTANLGGSIILAAIFCLLHSPMVGQDGSIACQVLSGLQDGFCGCLTTISTFALEIKTLPRRASYMYGVVSVVLTQVSMLLIVGSYVWTRGESSNVDGNVAVCAP